MNKVKKIKSQLSEELRRESRIRFRIKIITSVIGIVFGVVIVRAIELHCFKDPAIGRIVSKQYQAVIPQSLRRGRILDRSGKELAVSLPVPSIYADPRMISLSEGEKKDLVKLLDVNYQELSGK